MGWFGIYLLCILIFISPSFGIRGKERRLFLGSRDMRPGGDGAAITGSGLPLDASAAPLAFWQVPVKIRRDLHDDAVVSVRSAM